MGEEGRNAAVTFAKSLLSGILLSIEALAPSRRPVSDSSGHQLPHHQSWPGSAAQCHLVLSLVIIPQDHSIHRVLAYTETYRFLLLLRGQTFSATFGADQYLGC